MEKNKNAPKSGNTTGFIPTRWTMIARLRDGTAEEQKEARDWLANSYWKPAFIWLRCKGYTEADAQDRVQDFFLDSFQKSRFEKAHKARGRFRNFFLKSLKNFTANYDRYLKRKGRHPSKPMIHIDQYDTQGIKIELADTRTPDDYFNHAWLLDLLLRTVDQLKKHCLKKNMQLHFKLVYTYLIDPALSSKNRPSMTKLSERLGLERKDAFNMIETMKRALARLLKEEVQNYALSPEDIIEETRDVFRLLKP